MARQDYMNRRSFIRSLAIAPLAVVSGVALANEGPMIVENKHDIMRSYLVGERGPEMYRPVKPGKFEKIMQKLRIDLSSIVAKRRRECTASDT